MSTPDNELHILTGNFVLSTSKGVLRGEITPDEIQITSGSPELLGVSLESLAKLPVTIRPPLQRGKAPRTIERYQRVCKRDPLFAAIGQQFGFGPETVRLRYNLKDGNIDTIADLLASSEEDIRKIRYIGKGKRLNRILTLQQSLRQEKQQG